MVIPVGEETPVRHATGAPHQMDECHGRTLGWLSPWGTVIGRRAGQSRTMTSPAAVVSTHRVFKSPLRHEQVSDYPAVGLLAEFDE